MTQRNILQVPEQTARISIMGARFSFHFLAFRNLMYMDISEGDRVLVTGKRVMSNAWLIPSYEAEGIGNIRFETYKSDRDDYVWYDEFNTKFRLVSYSDAEIKAMAGET